MPPIDETHDPDLKSWVESANVPDAEFPIQNLPFGVFRTSTDQAPRLGVAIGDKVLDLRAAADLIVTGSPSANRAIRSEGLNDLMGLGRPTSTALRLALSRLLSAAGRRGAVEPCLTPIGQVELLLPASIGDYTDFYASVFHATNVGRLFRPDNPLLPNYKWVPIAYHGRASSIAPSGAPVRRPKGQITRPEETTPAFLPSRSLDYELELGIFVGASSRPGEGVGIDEAAGHVFGYVLLNDWSARDIQAWEYQPLGPFLSKSFATTISPWVVTAEALAPFQTRAFERPAGDPAPLPYLTSSDDQAAGALAIGLEAWLASAEMRRRGLEPMRLSHARAEQLYWTPAQMIAHHTSNGCALHSGDLLGSGTVSGPDRSAAGCLLEITARGAEPVSLPSGERRAFLEDGDEVILRGRCHRDGFVPIGFGECRGEVLPAL